MKSLIAVRIICFLKYRYMIRRVRLGAEEIEKEMEVIASTGLEEILILTGESRRHSDIRYIGEACKTARKYFRMIGLEVYPMNVQEYAHRA